RDFVKSKARQKVYFSEEVIDKLTVEGSSPAIDEARLHALSECRKKLSSADQQLIAVCYGGSSSIADVAQHSDRSVGSIYSNLWRIRRALYSCIQRAVSREGLA